MWLQGYYVGKIRIPKSITGIPYRKNKWCAESKVSKIDVDYRSNTEVSDQGLQHVAVVDPRDESLLHHKSTLNIVSKTAG